MTEGMVATLGLIISIYFRCNFATYRLRLLSHYRYFNSILLDIQAMIQKGDGATYYLLRIYEGSIKFKSQ